MILQTGNRTDIPAFYSEWFANRLKEGYVLVRNPFNPETITRYEINREVVDLIVFCTKNPAPMLQHMNLLSPYRQYWFVTITPYGREIEPNVPGYEEVIETFKKISDIVGSAQMCWRYDPIILNKEWSIARHIDTFKKMASALCGYTDVCVISFIDLYNKVRRNYPEVRSVTIDDQLALTKEFVNIGKNYHLTIKPCGESTVLESVGADCSGCMTVKTFENAIGHRLNVPPNPNNRSECACYITGDIGAYNTCGHLCRYCYANADSDSVARNMASHDPLSPVLIGHVTPGDNIHQAKQKSWIDPQMRIEDFI